MRTRHCRRVSTRFAGRRWLQTGTSRAEKFLLRCNRALIWLVRDFDLLNLQLRALSFALEALAFGALFFLGVVARPARLDDKRYARLRRAGAGFALALAVTQAVLAATTSAELVGS